MIFRFRHIAMNAQFEIRCAHDDEQYARQAARFAFEAVDRLEQQLSRFVETSDISRINHLAPGDETRVSIETMHCLQLARLAWQQTGGAFDPSIGTGFDRLDILPESFVVRWPKEPPKATAHESGPPDARTPGRPTSGSGPSDSAASTSDVGRRTSDDKIHLDLGALGKGYAVDRVADVLEDWDVSRALIDAGSSSVLVLDPPAGRRAWSLTLTAPQPAGHGAGEVFARLDGRQQALGASGIQKGDHIRDPRDGSAVRGRVGAWVSAPRVVLAEISREAGSDCAPSPAAMADALSTGFMLMPLDAIEQYCQARPGIEAWAVGAWAGRAEGAGTENQIWHFGHEGE